MQLRFFFYTPRMSRLMITVHYLSLETVEYLEVVESGLTLLSLTIGSKDLGLDLSCCGGTSAII
jgi:hypothetical protein